MPWRPRLSLQIGLLYTALAAINIAFFVFMILENQTDLLQSTFRYHSRALVQEVMSRNDSLRDRPDEQYYELLQMSLNEYEPQYGLIFDSSGKVLHRWNGSLQAPSGPGESILDRTQELAGREMIFRERFSLELYEEDWTADIILLLERPGNPQFLNVRLKIAAIQERMNEIRWHIILAILWGIIFHVLFGLFVYRIIFRRLSILKETSAQLQQGDFSSRADWDFVRGDELDDLGRSFNQMASTIEDKVSTIETQLDTIGSLNRTMRNELEIGKDVQRAFLPDFRSFQSFNPAFVYMPLREVSGDMCNMYRFDSGDIGIFLGDAAGHGVSAALITAMVTSAMDAALNSTHEPGALFEAVNAELCGRLTSLFYATGVYVLLRKGKLIHTGAGHVDCLLYRRATDDFLSLESQGTPIGIFPDMKYPEVESSYQSGDRLVLFSDGLTEARSGQQDFGMPRVRELIRDSLDLKGDELAARIEKSIREFRETDSDDVTLLALDL
ncbi:MAG: hypothetical protein CMN77_16545 [Spirochaetaceae bacterium]|nr:hypothetical protein [Spirochaetaceae bacterium]|tara:strand:- start:55386 stop:56882 length:1497 start_codon:yes stop_codon:yes gene_type:complete